MTDDLKQRANEALRAQLQYALRVSRFYREKFAESGAEISRIRTADDLAGLPFTEKDELRIWQEREPPLGGNQGVPVAQLSRVQGTGGTTGIPLRLGFTSADLAVLNKVAAGCIRCAGCGPGDVVLECMNYSMYVGGVTDHMAFETAGCCVLPHSVGKTRRLIELVHAMDVPWTLYSTPAYAHRLADAAVDMGYDPRDLKLVKGLFSGEGGLGSTGVRATIEQTWGLQSRDIYGLSETGFIGSECQYQNGIHVLCQESALTELIVPETGDVLPWQDGVEGELVFTTLRRQASFLIRFRSHDRVRVEASRCECGRQEPRIRILGRSDDMFIVRGINVFPLAVQDVLSGIGSELTGEFQIILDAPPPIDYAPVLRIEARALAEDLSTRIAREVRDRLNFSPQVELVAPGSLPRTPEKMRRLVRAYLEGT